ncbi:MAG: cation:proton antiporter [Candidatus Dojkabacteria bacterium]|nr:cation:proton antiporter [Candidatus Dojkabacteria bacterium]
MKADIFLEFAIILLLSAFLGFLFVKNKLPALLGFILTGLIIGPLTPGFLEPNEESIDLLSKIGVAMLLFTLGLELDLDELKKLGKVAFATGIGQIVFTSIVGIMICLAMGFSLVASLYIAIGLTFSSTIVIIKLLSQINQLDSLWGKISVGFLLVQDFVAILILIIISTLSGISNIYDPNIIFPILLTFVKALIVGTGVYLFTRFVMFPLLDSLRFEKEILFIISVAWAIGLAAFLGSEFIGFTIEVGGLIAGIALSSRYESLQIENWIKPLRDLFLAIFFVSLGMHIKFDSIVDAVLPSIIFSLFVLIGNPLIVMLIMGWMGYSKKVGFLTSLAVAQISEFSLIITNFAYTKLGILDNTTLTIMTLTGAITMVVSSYLIYYNLKIYEKIQNLLSIFEFKKKKAQEIVTEKDSYEIILVGCKRTGRNIIYKNKKNDILIIDLDIHNVKRLKREGYNVLYGDAADNLLWDSINLRKTRLVISTVPGLHENKTIIRNVKAYDSSILVVVVSSNEHDTKRLYDLGADFVVFPNLVAGELINSIVKHKVLKKSHIQSRRKHIEYLDKITM